MQLHPDEQHARLNAFVAQRMTPTTPGDPLDATALTNEMSLRLLEDAFVRHERLAVQERLQEVPQDPKAFVAWFESLKATGPGQGDPLFPFLAEEASHEQMRWFLKQEVAGEAGFDDLTALTQLRMPAQAKLELGANYWDELGRGNRNGMHGPMLERVAEHFELASWKLPLVWEAVAVGNLLAAFALNRQYAFHSVGALGVVELTAPGRVAQVDAGLRRLGVPARARHYFAIHATLDVKHSETWNREVLLPLATQRPDVIPAMAEGALMRLTAGARCFERYRRELGLTTGAAANSDVQAGRMSALQTSMPLHA